MTGRSLISAGNCAWPFGQPIDHPVRAIRCQKDTSLPPEENLSIIRRGLEKAGTKDVTIKVVPGADHGLKVTRTGGPKEAGERSKARKPGDAPDFAPGYLDLMSDWLTVRCVKRP